MPRRFDCSKAHTDFKFKSLLEIQYAQTKKIPIIPCRMQKDYQPNAAPGFIASDHIYFDLYDEQKLNENFHRLTNAIDLYQLTPSPSICHSKT